MKFWKSFSRHNAVGLLLACVLAGFLGVLVVNQTQEQLLRQHAERGAIMQVMALADMVSGAVRQDPAVEPVDNLNTILQEWQAYHLEVRTIRVIKLDGSRLLASTASDDYKPQALPRRLTQDEKPLYDLGHRLRQAVDINREEGIQRKEEMEKKYLKDGLVEIAAPYKINDKVAGFVQISAYLNIPETSIGHSPAILLSLIPVLLFVLLSQTPFFTSAENRKPATRLVLKPSILAFVLLVLGLGFFNSLCIDKYSADRQNWERTLVQGHHDQRAQVANIFEKLNLTDTYNGNRAYSLAYLYIRTPALDREDPRFSNAGLDTKVDEAAISEVEKQETGLVRKSLWGVFALAFLVLAFFAAGWAARLWHTFNRYRYAYLYIAPAIISMLVLVFFPFGYGITLSFTDSNIYTASKPLTDSWIWFQNYVSILGQFDLFTKTEDGGSVLNYSSFYWTLLMTFIWTIANVIVGVSVGLMLALALNTKDLRFKTLYRVILILPWAIPNYITALIWKGMFHQQFGAINQVIQMFGGSPVAWYDSTFTSFLTNLATNGWLSFPFMMVISLGALQSIDASMYEAARVEGANRWQQFRYITLPSLKPTLVPAIILSVVWTFNMFNVIYLVSGGEPAGSTEILVTKAYKIAFEEYRYGYAAAYSTIIFGILVIYSIFQNRISKASSGNN